MKGRMNVKHLSKTGNYVSQLDYDESFACENNPGGLFKMVIHPIENEIRYMRTAEGIVVSGESYIVSGSDSEIAEKVKMHMTSRWPGLVQREVNNSNELW